MCKAEVVWKVILRVQRPQKAENDMHLRETAES